MIGAGSTSYAGYSPTAPGTAAFSNAATITLNQANLTALGAATISGSLQSNGSTITFNDGITLNSTGAIQLTKGDQWVVAGGNFINNSASTSNAVTGVNLAMVGNGAQTLTLGTTQAASLVWGSVEIGASTTLSISGGKLLVDDLILDGPTVPDLSNIVINNSNTISDPQAIAADTENPAVRVTFFTSTTGGFTFSNNATYLNTGTFDNETDQSFAGVGTFHNTGTFRKQASTGVTAFSIPFNNDGLIDVRSGTLSLQGGGAGSGTATVSSGATLEIRGSTFASTGAIVNNGNLSVTPGSIAAFDSISGSGTTNLSASTLTLANASSTGNLILNQATIAGAATDNTAPPASPTALTVNGSFQSSNGLTLTNGIALNVTSSGSIPSQTIGGASNASFNVQPGAVITHDDSGTLTFQQRVVSIAGELDVNHGAVNIFNGGTHSGAWGTRPAAAAM